jgi:hypothetical protein
MTFEEQQQVQSISKAFQSFSQGARARIFFFYEECV